MLKKEKKCTQEFYPFESILDNGLIKIKNGYLKILKITPINYELKSTLEKEAILNSYKLFLKTCNFNFQILIQSKKENLSNYISKLQKNIEESENLQSLCNSYLSYIEKIEKDNNSSFKEFYIILKYEYKESEKNLIVIQNVLSEETFKIKDTLSRCGNTIEIIASKLGVIEFLKEYCI